ARLLLLSGGAALGRPPRMSRRRHDDIGSRTRPPRQGRDRGLLSMEGVGAGITLVLMLTIGSFVSVLLLGGSDTLILPPLIYQQVILLNNNFAAALGMLLLGISVVLLYVQAQAFRIRGAA